MNWDWAAAILAFLGLVIVPRFILELAWSRRVRAKAQASGKDQMSLIDRLRAKSLPWIAFGVIGLACAIVALMIFALR